MQEIVYAIVDRDNGKFATYGRSEFKEGIRFARLYKSRKTALRHYFSNNNKYEGLNLMEIKIETLNEEYLKPEDFEEYKGG